jgi:hypothetical protein
MRKSKKFYTDIYSFFIQKKNINKNRLEKIFSLLRIDNTFKTTSFNRMVKINKKLIKYIKKSFSKKVMICDFGVSSGQSTLELYNDLNRNKIQYIYGFDKQIYLKIYKIKKLILLYSLRNELLMIEYDKHCLRYRYYLIFKKIEKLVFNLLEFLNIKYEKSNVLMPNLKKIDKCKFFEQNIFNIEKRYHNLFDVVRVSNLLNYAYFSEDKLRIAISNIKKISKEKSIILINRTTRNNKDLASFFIKKKDKFYLLEDINGGPEIKKLMLE